MVAFNVSKPTEKFGRGGVGTDFIRSLLKGFVALWMAAALFSSCTVFDSGAKKASVSFSIDGAALSRLSSRAAGDAPVEESPFSGWLLSVALKGSYSQKQEVILGEEGNAVVFEDVPVGASIYGEATLSERLEDGTLQLRYQGVSPTITVAEIENTLQIVLKRVAPDGDEEDVDNSFHIYITVNNTVDPEMQDGSQEYPFADLSDAINLIKDMNDPLQEYTLDISGMLGVSVIEDETDSPIVAASITLTGADTTGENGIDAGWSGEGIAPENFGTALTVSTIVPLIIKNLTIRGGFYQYENGGGIALLGDSSLTLKEGALITRNYAYKGGGVYVANGEAENHHATLRMEGGEISGNTATDEGGGVYLACRDSSEEVAGTGAVFTMSGGTISGNTCSYSGAGVYVSGYVVSAVFSMEGSALIASDNDVYLSGDSDYGDVDLIISGPLTTEGVVATVTPYEYYTEKPVLSFSGEAAVSFKGSQIAITGESDGVAWNVNEEGKLAPVTELYVRADGGQWVSGWWDDPFRTIELAIERIKHYSSSAYDYTIKISGTLKYETGDDFLMLSDADGDLNAVAASITLEGVTGNDSDILNGTNNKGNRAYNVLRVETSVPLTIKNLTITAGNTGVYVNNENAEITLGEGCLITENGTSSGLYIGTGTVTLDGGTITSNSGTNGAGVNIVTGTFIMNGGTISYNEGAEGESCQGGGVYVGYEVDSLKAGTFTMNGGTISDNTANEGGGVYVSGGTDDTVLEENVVFTMNGGTIAGNTCTDPDTVLGADVYVHAMYGETYGRFNMGGQNINTDALLNMDVYLDAGAVITIIDELPGSSVAQITSGEYNVETKVLEGVNGDSGLLERNYEAFLVKEDVSNRAWYVHKSGTITPLLFKEAPDATGDIVFADGSAAEIPSTLSVDDLGGYLNDQQKADAIAVIFHNGTELSDEGKTRVLGIGLQRGEGMEWTVNGSEGYSITIDPLVLEENSGTFTGSHLNGSNNLELMGEFLENQSTSTDDTATEEKYPAFYYAKNYGDIAKPTNQDLQTGWYLPSGAEMYAALSMENINAIFNALGYAENDALIPEDGSYHNYLTSSQGSGTANENNALVITVMAGFDPTVSADDKAATDNYVYAVREF